MPRYRRKQMAQLSQLLLFDPDPSGLDTLTYGFEKDGCSVTGTSDPAKARDLAQGGGPSLFLLNLRDSEQVGLDLLRGVAANPRTRNLACVAIGRDELRPSALAAGAFTFLSVPLFVRDVIGVCRLVAAASVPGSRPSPDAEVSLALQDLDGVYFLVRALAVTGRSSLVEARRGQVRGELRFIHGTLRSAEVGAVHGLPALHHMLLWDDAALRFKFKNVVRRGSQLSLKSGEVLEECDRFLRDFAHEVKELGFSGTTYAAQFERVQPSAALPSEVVPILKLFDGRRDLAQILDESPFRIFDTLKIIKRFVADGAVQLKSSAPPARVGGAASARADFASGLSGPAALDFWWQRQTASLGSELGLTRHPQNGISAIGGAAGTTGASGGVARPSSPFVALGSAPLGAAPVDPALFDITPPASAPRSPAPLGSTGPVASFPAPRRGGRRPSAATGLPLGAVTGIPSHAPATTRSNQAAVASLRTRKITKKNLVDPPPAQFPEDMITPPPVINSSNPPAKPATTVVRGEIKIAAAPSSRAENAPVDTPPSVMVEPELGSLPSPIPLASKTAPPVSAQTAAPPSVIVAPMTPSPVLVEALRVLDPHPPAPEVAPAQQAPGGGAVQPAAISAVGGGEAESRRHKRPPADSFNAVESDFFDREADLYKRESVETFDDLDNHLNGTRKP